MEPSPNKANFADFLYLQVKLDSPAKPSRVLHFRGVPSDVTEGEILHLGLPFGRMTNLVLVKKKNQVSHSGPCYCAF